MAQVTARRGAPGCMWETDQRRNHALNTPNITPSKNQNTFIVLFRLIGLVLSLLVLFFGVEPLDKADQVIVATDDPEQ